MCRKGGRRCDAKWDRASRERYNARRRVTRNTEKAHAAREAGREGKADYYDSLAASATVVASHYDALIQAHENEGTATGEQHERGYRVGHTAPTDDGYSKPVTRLTDGFFGDDVYDHPDWYGTADDETMEQLRAVRDNPDATMRVYRAVPPGHQEINQGDWITLSRDYAETHAFDLEGEGQDGTVVSMTVPASTVFTDGNDLAEYGYDGPDADLSPIAAAGTPGIQRERCPDCGQFAGDGHACRAGAEGHHGGGGHPLAVQDATPVDFPFIRNPVPLSGNQAAGMDFGQDTEPAGRYLTESAGTVPDGWESGTVRFEKPLHMHWGESGQYTTEDNWKQRLSAHYGGKTGKELSQAIRDDGYDAIVTHDKYGTSETVDLTGFAPTGTQSASAAASADDDGPSAPATAREFGDRLAAKHGVTMDLSGGSREDSYVTLNHIEVPREQRGTGIGKQAMQDLVDEADRNGWKLDLTPSGDFGGSVPKLKRFYKQFGFVENKGRNKDYATRELFLRLPQ